MKPISLSGRLQAVAAMVTVGNRVCDVGCDHGFIPIYLVERGISPYVLAMDVKSGPLSAAKEHIAERGLEAVIETRLSDGLHNYNKDEADTLVCAGMGGRLMMRILSDDRIKTESFRELILQPQSEPEQFRAWLRNQGYRITDENMIEEEGKFYPMMRVETGDTVDFGYGGRQGRMLQSREARNDNMRDYMDDYELCKPSNCFSSLDDAILCKLCDRYGPVLLRSKNSTLASFLRREERIYKEILSELQAQDLSDDKRKKRHVEISELLEECRMALDIVT